VVVNTSWRSYIIRHDQSGFSYPNHKGKGNNNYNVISKEIITAFNQGNVHGSNALWDYVVVNATWRSYIIRHDQ
jgi:hypothetical protein